jgi:hypothetical protein
MAKKRRSPFATRVVRIPAARPVAPIIRVSAPAAMTRRAKVRRHAARVGGIVGNSVVSDAIGGAIVGYLVKSGLVAKLPAVPFLGRMGTAALAADFIARRGGGDMARRVARGCATIAGYQLGHDGAIQGDDFVTSGDDDGVYAGYGDEG